MVRSVLSSYPSHLDAQLCELQQAFQRGSQRDVHRIAHSIKGGALNLGASPLSEIALRIERSARTGDLKSAAVDLARVVLEAQRVSSYLRQVYKE